MESSEDIGVKLMREILVDTQERQEFLAKNDAVMNMLEHAFATNTLSDPEYIACKVLVAAYWYASARVKLHDFTLHGVEVDKLKNETKARRAEREAIMGAAPEDQRALELEAEAASYARKVADDLDEAMATEGFSGVLKACNFLGSYSAPRTGRFYQVLLGNCFRLINKTDDKTKPFMFECIDPSSVYFPSNNVTCIRNGNKPTDQLAVVFKMSRRQALSAFADEIKANSIDTGDIKGAIPRGANNFKDTDQRSETQIKENEVEVAYFWKISDTSTPVKQWTENDCGVMYRCVIGSKMLVLDKKDGAEEYGKEWGFSPYEGAQKTLYIPVTQRTLYEPVKGFFGYGVGHIVYDIAKTHQVLDNHAIMDGLESSAPIKFLGIPDGVADAYNALYQEALQNRAAGFGGVVPIPNSNGGLNAQSFGGGGDLNKTIALKRELELALKRVGIHLDEIQGYAATATQAELDAAKAGEFFEYISRNNAQEFEFEIKVALELFKGSKADKVPLDVRVDFGGEEFGGLTYGDLRDLFKKKHWFVEVEGGSAQVPFNALRRLQVREDLKYLPQGSQEFADAASELSLLTGRSKKKNKPLIPQPVAPQTMGQAAQPLNIPNL